ncbi:RHS repeat-associated core domain-containing protein [uncultured Chryseobacterium sp.]|uniref:RHS repeat-associated core domain-containing protein n=1 Tax=uncultured Chryseobacterium sp. TaxID=259322 RepID=UPI00261A2097|nr:RHS repeat-associated core domain-containing protein [uncultured Chryseobacterium sp.]
MVEKNDYYAFGLKHGDPTDTSGLNYNYEYNGKEYQDEISMYDYGARFYMPDIGRWGVQDQKSEAYYNYSQYQYVLNNPVINIDIKGEWTVTKHYNMTYSSLSKAGFGKKQADLIAHYASVYADNPGKHIHANNAAHPTNMMSYRKGIDYSPTVSLPKKLDNLLP